MDRFWRKASRDIRRRPNARTLLARDHQLFDLRDRLGRVEAFGARLRAVHDRVAAIEAERIFEIVEPFARRFVAAVGDPAIRLEQYRRPQIAVAVPPIARARGRAREAQDAFPHAVELGALVGALQAFAIGRRRFALEPRFDRAQLRIGLRQIGH